MNHGHEGYEASCRCQHCLDAGPVTRHGHGGYVTGCRCDICVDARRVYNRQWMARKRAEQRSRTWRLNGHRWTERLDRGARPLVACDRDTFLRWLEEGRRVGR